MDDGGTVQQDIVLSVPGKDRSFAEAIQADSSLNVTELTGAGMDGGSEYLVLLIPVAHFTVKTLVDLFKAHWEKARNVKLEVNGMAISGASLTEISDFLERNCQKRDGN
jgi:hypothetical protein